MRREAESTALGSGLLPAGSLAKAPSHILRTGTSSDDEPPSCKSSREKRHQLPRRVYAWNKVTPSPPPYHPFSAAVHFCCSQIKRYADAPPKGHLLPRWKLVDSRRAGCVIAKMISWQAGLTFIKGMACLCIGHAELCYNGARHGYVSTSPSVVALPYSCYRLDPGP